MASWTNQSTSSLLPGEPWTSAKALAAFENPEAIAEGASGAPKVRTAALQEPAAGANIIRRLRPISASYVSPATSGSESLAEGSVGVLVGGTITLSMSIATSGTVTSWSVTVSKNFSTEVAYTQASGAGAKSADITVALGDILEIECTVNGGGASGGVDVTDIQIKSATTDLAVT